MRRNVFLVALIVVAAAASVVEAAMFNLTPTVTARFDDAFNPLPLTSPGGGPITDGPGIYQVDMSFTISELGPTERGWANTAFDVMLMGDLTDAGGGYAADNPNPFFDTNGGLPGGGVPKYSTNQDAGTAGDLQGILASIAGGPMTPADPRKDLGKASPSLLGSVFVRSTGAPGQVMLKNVRFSTADQSGLFLQSQEAAGSVLEFGEVAPPNTPPVGIDAIINDVMAGAGMTVTHQFQATDLEDAASALVWSNLQFSGVPGNMGSGVHLFSPTLDPDGLFNWNTNGSARGVYTATATVTDTGGLSDTAILTIDVTKVPEPTTLVLFGLALVGFAACRRG